jgi:hypothetical protein
VRCPLDDIEEDRRRYLTRTPDAEVRAIFTEFATFWTRRAPARPAG